MVIGNGLIAKAFDLYRDNNTVLIYAAGVSNSKQKDINEFKREEDLIKKSIKEYKNLTFVYFSTTSVYDLELKDLPYIKHKLAIENLITRELKSYYIFRLPEVVGHSDNKSTIVNFLYHSITAQLEFEVWKNACRRIIDVEDIAQMSKDIIENGKYKNKTINLITNKRTKITDLIAIFEMYSGKNSHGIEVNRGNCYDIDAVDDTITMKLSTDESYNDRLIKKYYF